MEKEKKKDKNKKKNKKKILIIDGNLLARKTFYKFQNLSTELTNREVKIFNKELIQNNNKKRVKISKISDGSGTNLRINSRGKIESKLEEISQEQERVKIYTGVLYGMLRSILLAKERFNIGKIIICYDPPPKISNQIRYEIESNYKNRKKDPETEIKFNYSIILAQAFFYKIGIEQVTSTKFEADDLLHYYTHNKFKNRKCIVLTNDHDLFQVLEKDRVEMLSIGSDYSLYTEDDFRKDFQNISPKQYRDVLALGGCSTDNVSGVPGISKHAAATLISKAGDIKSLLKHYKEIEIPKRSKTAIEKEINNDLENLKLSLKLVSLYGLNKHLKSDLLPKKTQNSPEMCYKHAIFLLKLLKFRSFLTESSKYSLKSLIGVKGETDHER